MRTQNLLCLAKEFHHIIRILSEYKLQMRADRTLEYCVSFDEIPNRCDDDVAEEEEEKEEKRQLGDGICMNK